MKCAPCTARHGIPSAFVRSPWFRLGRTHGAPKADKTSTKKNATVAAAAGGVKEGAEVVTTNGGAKKATEPKANGMVGVIATTADGGQAPKENGHSANGKRKAEEGRGGVAEEEEEEEEEQEEEEQEEEEEDEDEDGEEEDEVEEVEPEEEEAEEGGCVF